MIEILSTAIESFKQDTGHYPYSHEGLSALSLDLGDSDTWKGPYLRKLITRDPWGNYFVYVYPPVQGAIYDLYSLGNDGATLSNGNDEDDINSWDGSKHWRIYYAELDKNRERYYFALKIITCFTLPFVILYCSIALHKYWRK